VILEARADPPVTLHFIPPATPLRIGPQLTNVDELGAEGRRELSCRKEVLAGLADVRVGAGLGGEMARAESHRDAGLEELRGARTKPEQVVHALDNYAVEFTLAALTPVEPAIRGTPKVDTGVE
jgi:hypothetical protein